MIELLQRISIFAVTILLFAGCIKNNPDPSWIRIEKWELEANPQLNLQEGVLTHNFTDVWLYVNEKLIGVFELPVKIPVLVHGTDIKIQCYPAIRNNGISATKAIYPFVEPYIINADLVQNETLTINPVTRYSSVTKFWIEDFEDVAFKMENDINVSTANLFRTINPEKVMYGNGCGQVNLTSSDSLWLAYTNGQIVLPKGKAVYLEVDYKIQNPILAGLIGISSQEIKEHPGPFITANQAAQQGWRKIYIELREIVSFAGNYEYYEVYLRSILDISKSEAELLIDNIKLVYL